MNGAAAQLAEAVRILRAGGLVAMPTETVYGLAANAFDARAVARVFEVKRRPFFDPLIVHVAAAEDLARVVREVPQTAERLIRRFWPGPLTLVLPKRDEVPDLVTAGLGTVAVRMPDHPLALALLRAVAVPLAAPSANPFGAISPTAAEHVRRQLGDAVDLVLDGGPCRVGVESTILGWRGGMPVLLRAGGLPIEAIEREIGPVSAPAPAAGAERPDAPGQMLRHYAPRTPLRLLAEGELPAVAGRVGWIGLDPPPAAGGPYAAVEILPGGGDLREAAAALFAALHRLDALGLDGLHARPVPERGLGRAINDRLRRASNTPEGASGFPQNTEHPH